MTNILIAGGGLAGGAVAVALAQAGQNVTLLERETAPVNKICGEFLSGEAAGYLRALGLNVAALGGERVTHVRLVRGSRAVTSALPFEGLGLSRKVLDEALLRHAEAAGAVVRRGVAARNIGDDLTVQTSTGETLRPARLLLATGKHEARGAARTGKPGETVGFKMYFRLARAQTAELARHVELILFAGGYAGLQLVENRVANLSLLVSRESLHEAGGKWEELLAVLMRASPHLARRLAGAEALLEAPLAIARVPYGFVHRHKAGDPAWLYRLGDQVAVIESFTGDGMSIALHSAMLAARFVASGGGAQAYHGQLARDVRGQIRRASGMRWALSARGIGPALFAASGLYPRALALSAALTRLPQRVQMS